MSDAYTVVDRLVAAINDHDIEAAKRCYSSEAVAVDPQGLAEGPEEIASFHALVWEGFPDLRITVWEKPVCGDTAVIEVTVTATHSGPFLLPDGELLEPTGKAINVRACWAFTVDEDAIVAQRVYFDQLELYTALGARLVLDDAAGGQAQTAA